MTTQEICDRLAEDDGWRKHGYGGWLRLRNSFRESEVCQTDHPFRHNSIDDAIRAIPGDYQLLRLDRLCGDLWECSFFDDRLDAFEIRLAEGEEGMADAVYQAVAKMKGWVE